MGAHVDRSDSTGRAGLVVLLALLLLVAAVLGVAIWMAGERSRSPVSAAPAARGSSPSPSTPSPSATAPAAPRAADPLRVLHDFDRARARAWAAGDTEALRRLYAPDSTAGRRDAALLTAYADRGLRVRGLRMQVLAADVERETPSLTVIRVTDRLVGARAVRGQRSWPLPHDRASTRVLRFVRVDGVWLLDRVRSA